MRRFQTTKQGYREPDLDTLCALSRYYGLTLDELLDVNGEQHEPIYDLSPVLKNKIHRL